MDDETGLLTVDQVRDRYRLRTRRAARQVMREAGGFTIARRLVVREADLVTYEHQRQRTPVHPDAPTSMPVTAKRRARPAGRGGSLPPGWWRENRD